MNCTPEEIAEKRRIAIERLNARKASTNNRNGQTVTTLPKPVAADFGKPLFKLPQKQIDVIDAYIANKTSKDFVQTATNQTTSSNFVKYQKPFIFARANTQPYARNALVNRSSNLASVTCSCSIVSETRFVVQPSKFNDKLVEVFKSIPSKQYDPSAKRWTFAIKDYAIVQEKVYALNPHVSIGSIPKFVLSCFNADSKPNRSCLNAIEPFLARTLLEFQKDGVCFAIHRGGRALIADEMGLGKTYQALAVADFYRENWPLLICTTASTRDAWAAKIRQLFRYVSAQHMVTLQGSQDHIGHARIVISSYSLMERCAQKLQEHGFGFIIMDESHTLKNSKAKCTVVAQELAKSAKRVILLTGTPALSRPVELFSQLQMLDRTFFSFKEYSARYCDGKQTNFGWDASGQSNLEELNVLLAAKFMIRRTKQEVMSQLTEKSRETVILDSSLLSKDEETELNLSSYAVDYSTTKGRDREEILLQYYSATAEAKAPAVCEYLKEVLKEKQKFIIFAHHIKMLDVISEFLTKQKVDHVRIDGTTKSTLRSQLVDTFQTNNLCRAAVLSLKACNAGITLTAAQLVLFAELDWNPSTLAQAESRAHRIGQVGAVVVRYLLAKGTADDVIWAMLQKKQNILNKAGLCNEDFSDSTNVEGPSSAGNIKPYLEKRPSSSTLDKYDMKESTGTGTSVATTNSNSGLQKLLDDGDDDDLAGIEF